MSDQLIITLVGGTLALIGVIATVVGTRGKTRADAKSALDARIDARVSSELARAYSRLDSLDSELRTVYERLELAERQIVSAESQTFEMIAHIILLEGMIPNPPGPPSRPLWKLPLLTDRPEGKA